MLAHLAADSDAAGVIGRNLCNLIPTVMLCTYACQGSSRHTHNASRSTCHRSVGKTWQHNWAKKLAHGNTFLPWECEPSSLITSYTCCNLEHRFGSCRNTAPFLSLHSNNYNLVQITKVIITTGNSAVTNIASAMP